MRFSIVNASTLVSNDDAKVLAEVERHSLSVFCGQWGFTAPGHVEVVDPAGAAEEAAEGETLIVLLDDADQAGALGYHALTPDGKVYANVFVRDSIADLAGVDPAGLTGPQPLDLLLTAVLPVVDHEAKEAQLDPDAADMVDDGAGTLWAKEACDAIESDNDPTTVVLADGRTVAATLSNHVLPDYFRPGSPGPWDHSGKLTGPFTYDAGGYVLFETAGELQQRFGDALPPARRERHEFAFAAARSGGQSADVASRTGWRTIVHALKGAADEGLEAKVSDDAPAAIAGADPDAAAIPPIGSEPLEEEFVVAEPAGHPEPTPVGHAILQDNVTEPGVQTTHHVDEDGKVLRSFAHADDDRD